MRYHWCVDEIEKRIRRCCWCADATRRGTVDGCACRREFPPTVIVLTSNLVSQWTDKPFGFGYGSLATVVKAERTHSLQRAARSKCRPSSESLMSRCGLVARSECGRIHRQSVVDAWRASCERNTTTSLRASAIETLVSVGTIRVWEPTMKRAGGRLVEGPFQSHPHR